MIRALVLDFGNVISEPHDTGCYARMAEISGLSTDFFMKGFWKFRPEFDRGALSGMQMYRDVLADAAVSLPEAELDTLARKLLDEDLGSWFHISRDVTEWALGLQACGLRLGILSNMPPDFMERYGKRIELFTKADTAVFSCYVNQIKPEPPIYQTLIDRIGCAPCEIVFFDDLIANVEAARRAGINAFVWTGLERAKLDLAEIARGELSSTRAN